MIFGKNHNLNWNIIEKRIILIQNSSSFASVCRILQEWYYFSGLNAGKHRYFGVFHRIKLTVTQVDQRKTKTINN